MRGKRTLRGDLGGSQNPFRGESQSNPLMIMTSRGDSAGGQGGESASQGLGNAMSTMSIGMAKKKRSTLGRVLELDVIL